MTFELISCPYCGYQYRTDVDLSTSTLLSDSTPAKNIDTIGLVLKQKENLSNMRTSRRIVKL
jgi:hypothetical protein